jgi:DNA repair exonuclease SbcCD nuclease subunit
MARALIYSDIHFHHAWPEFNPLMPSGLNKRLEIQIDVWKQIEVYAQKYNCNFKAFSGDLFHKRSFLHTTAINSILDLYKTCKTPEVFIFGNHDRYSQEFNSAQCIDGIGEARIVPKNGNDFITFTDGKEAIVIAGAHPGQKLPVKPMFDATQGGFKKVTYILLAHGVLNGSKSQSGFELEGGYNLEEFKEWGAVALGDIHLSQIKGNVLIPGSTQQMNWGDSDLHCGCWLLNTEQPNNKDGNWRQVGTCWVKFLPLYAPRFIKVTKENFEEICKVERDDFNYYDFKLNQEVPPEFCKEIKKRFPNSYLSVTEVKKEKAKVSISQKTNTPKEILEKYYDLRVKGSQKDRFVEQGMTYLFQADPTQVTASHKDIKLLWIKAHNFLCYEDVFLDLRTLKRSLYQITGTSDEETSEKNGVGKSSLITELLSYVLYDKLCRSASRSKDRLIHDPQHLGKAKDMFGEVGMEVEGQVFIVQRYRRHVLGTGSRILKQEV